MIALGVCVGLVFGASRLTGGKKLNGAVSIAPAAVMGAPEAEDQYIAAALRYARALQDGFCEEVIRSTAWMDDRLHRVAMESSGQETIDNTWDSLCKKVMDRSIEGNLLVPEGIEDQYVFAPGVTMEVVGTDAGRQDLDRPVAERVWIRATFPRKQTAPLARADGGSRMLAVRAMTVGVDITRDDRLVAKAGVIGNLEIDTSSLSFDWTAANGG